MNIHGSHSILVNLQYNKARNMLMAYGEPYILGDHKEKTVYKV